MDRNCLQMQPLCVCLCAAGLSRCVGHVIYKAFPKEREGIPHELMTGMDGLPLRVEKSSESRVHGACYLSSWMGMVLYIG